MRQESHFKLSSSSPNDSAATVKLKGKTTKRNYSMREPHVEFSDSKQSSQVESPLSRPQLVDLLHGKTIMNLRDFKLKWALKKMARRLRGLTVPQNDSSGGATEEWEGNVGDDLKIEKGSRRLLHQSQWLNRLLQPVMSIVYFIVCWYVSVDMAYGIGKMDSSIVGVWILVLIVDIVLALNTVRISKGKSLRTHYTIFLDYLKRESYIDLTMAAYAVASHFDSSLQLDLTMHIVVLLLLIIKLHKKAQLLRGSFVLKKYIGLVDSVLILIVASHLSAILLFLSSKFVPDASWLQHIGIQNESWSCKYIYSLYWAVTTIVTVGYGDITPQNQYEVVVTILIEVSGSALFGYLINVIGATMTELKYILHERRKEKENLEEELSIAERLVKCLSLKDDLAYELKSFLKDNQKADAYFSISDEKRIWEKLKPDLKQSKVQSTVGILQDTNIRVIKKCIFFLTNFSRNLQDTIALKLVKRVYQPNQRIGMDALCHSLFIVDQGKTDLQYARTHFNKPIYKTLRAINGESRRQTELGTSSNLFGFTSVVLRRRVNVTALSREFIVTYELQQKEFDELLTQYSIDFEAVCQLRDLMLNTSIPESYQGPELLDPAMHFVPIKQMIVRKGGKNSPQRRRLRSRRVTRRTFDRYELMNDAINEQNQNSLPEMDNFAEGNSVGSGIRTGTRQLRCLKPEELAGADLSPSSTSSSIITINMLSLFDQQKSYSKYFIGCNIQGLLKRFNPIDKHTTTTSHKGLGKRLRSRLSFTDTL